MSRICTACAKPFTDEPWRIGCDVCGNLCVAQDDANILDALNRAGRYALHHTAMGIPTRHRRKTAT